MRAIWEAVGFPSMCASAVTSSRKPFYSGDILVFAGGMKKIRFFSKYVHQVSVVLLRCTDKGNISCLLSNSSRKTSPFGGALPNKKVS